MRQLLYEAQQMALDFTRPKLHQLFAGYTADKLKCNGCGKGSLNRNDFFQMKDWGKSYDEDKYYCKTCAPAHGDIQLQDTPLRVRDAERSAAKKNYRKILQGEAAELHEILGTVTAPKKVDMEYMKRYNDDTQELETDPKKGAYYRFTHAGAKFELEMPIRNIQHPRGGRDAAFVPSHIVSLVRGRGQFERGTKQKTLSAKQTIGLYGKIIAIFKQHAATTGIGRFHFDGYNEAQATLYKQLVQHVAPKHGFRSTIGLPPTEEIRGGDYDQSVDFRISNVPEEWHHSVRDKKK